MKLCKDLSLLFICYGFCHVNGEVNKGDGWEYDNDLNLVGLQEDDKEIIYRPCDLSDLQCIREFFAENSQCSITKGPAQDPLIMDRNVLYLPLVNTSIILSNVQVSGLNNAEIKEFYVNKYTGNVVLALYVYGLSERSSHTSFRYKRTGKEPIVLTDYTTVTYQELRYTAVIPKVPHLQLHKADIHVDIPDSNPIFITGPNAFNNTELYEIAAYGALVGGLNSSLREALLLKSSLYVTIFIQDNICDFGQKTKSL